MSDTQTFIHPYNHVGSFSIGTHLPGALELGALLSVPQNSSTVTGHGLLTQTTHPPLHASTAFHGVVHILAFGGTMKQIYSLQGVAVPPIQGAPHVTQLVITLDGIWGTKGTASYSYVTGSQPHDVKDQPVSVRWLLQQ